MVDIEGIQAFPGHMCPGLAIGIRASELALREIGSHSVDEEIVAIVETDMCGVDAIQYLTGCTFGKGNLIHRDYGKNAFTFIRRADGKAMRVSLRPDALRSPEAGDADMTREERVQQILEAPESVLFDVQHVEPNTPQRARILESLPCDVCGEMTMETRTRRLHGKTLCIPCFQALERDL